jgi:nucleolar protein 12
MKYWLDVRRPDGSPAIFHTKSESTMSSSLVESIFGGVVVAPASSSSSLFATKVAVPTEPHSYPVLRKRKKATESKNEIDGTKEDTTTPRKARKANDATNSKGTRDSAEAETSNSPVVYGPALNPALVTTTAPGDSDEADAVRTVFVGNLPLWYTRRDLHKLFSDCGSIHSTRIRSVPVTGVKLPPALAGQQDVVKKVCSNTQRLDVSTKQCVSGYVVFVSVESVAAALEKNNTAVPSMNHKAATAHPVVAKNNPTVRHIRVDRVVGAALPQANATTASTMTIASRHDASRSVFVGNLPYTADEETLAAHFATVLNRHAKDTIPTEQIIEGVRIVRDKDTQLCKGFGYVLFSDTSFVASALQTCHGTKYLQKNELRVLVCGKRTKNQQGQTTVPKATARRQAALSSATGGAVQRVLLKQLTAKPPTKSRRKRGGPSSSNASSTKMVPAKKAGPSSKSKRAVSMGKTEQRVKKIEKRIAKGMGKARK